MINLSQTNQLYVRSGSSWVQSNLFMKYAGNFISVWPTGPAEEPVTNVSASIVATGSVDNANAATYTFSAQSFGAVAGAGETRYIAVTFGGTNSKAHTGLTMSIGGVSATVYSDQSAVGAHFAGVAIAAVPTGLTGNIVFTFGGGGLKTRGISIMVVRMINFVSTPTATEFITNTLTPSSTLSATNVGILLGVVSNETGTSFSWSNGTEQYSFNGSFNAESHASQFVNVNSPTETISCTLTSGTSTDTAFHASSWELT